MDVRPGYQLTEVGVIPENWEVHTIIDVSQKIMDFRGRTPKKLGMCWGGGDIPALSAGNVRKGFVDFSIECYLGSDELYQRWMTQGRVQKGDVLFTTEAPLGNAALVPDDRKYILSQRTILIRGKPEVLRNDYVFQVFISAGFQNILRDYSSGSTAKGIQRKRFEKLQLALPKIEEQTAIATALGDMDALLDRLDCLIAKKRAIKQAAMQQLLTGQTRLPGFEGAWEVKTFGDCASIRNQKILPSQVDQDRLCIELEHIGQGDGRLLSKGEARNSSATKYCFQPGDILFGRLRSYLRKYWLATENGICTTEIWPFVCDKARLVPDFLYALVQTDAFIEVASISYGTHMPRADWSVIRNFEFRLPSIEEQTAIASLLSDMDAEITALEARRNKTRALKQAMMQELLTGKTRLVPPS